MLIFVIYLVLSGRISEFTYRDFEVKLKDVINDSFDKINDILQQSPVMSDPTTEDKSDIDTLEGKIIPKLRQMNETIDNQLNNSKDKIRFRVLEIHRPGSYNTEILYEYLQYFNYVVFLDNLNNTNRLNGFAITFDLLLKKKDERENLVGKINKWSKGYEKLKPPFLSR